MYYAIVQNTGAYFIEKALFEAIKTSLIDHKRCLLYIDRDQQYKAVLKTGRLAWFYSVKGIDNTAPFSSMLPFHKNNHCTVGKFSSATVNT